MRGGGRLGNYQERSNRVWWLMTEEETGRERERGVTFPGGKVDSRCFGGERERERESYICLSTHLVLYILKYFHVRAMQRN